MQAMFTGFDSAWGVNNSGAICTLVLQEDGSLKLDGVPVAANWCQALHRAEQDKGVDLHIWAIDEPLCVRNEAGCRPVDRDLARALMGRFGCGAYPANLGNPCWARGARIWDFLRVLEENGYVHNPMGIPRAKAGRYYFECYPHPALLGLFDLDRVIKYKVRHRRADEWARLIGLLRSLATRELPIRNISDFVDDRLGQSKENEDKVDAIISAYTATYWWKFGVCRSTLIGDLSTGYMVSPHSKHTYTALAEVFSGRMNSQGAACAPPQRGEPSHQVEPPPNDRQMGVYDAGGDSMPAEPPDDWSEPVELVATDTTNLWRTSRGAVTNPWMDASRMTGWRLWVRFINEDGEPAVLFESFRKQGDQQGGMRAPRHQINLHVWRFLVAGATVNNPVYSQVRYRYEHMQSTWQRQEFAASLGESQP